MCIFFKVENFVEVFGWLLIVLLIWSKWNFMLLKVLRVVFSSSRVSLILNLGVKICCWWWSVWFLEVLVICMKMRWRKKYLCWYLNSLLCILLFCMIFRVWCCIRRRLRLLFFGRRRENFLFCVFVCVWWRKELS